MFSLDGIGNEVRSGIIRLDGSNHCNLTRDVYDLFMNTGRFDSYGAIRTVVFDGKRSISCGIYALLSIPRLIIGERVITTKRWSLGDRLGWRITDDNALDFMNITLWNIDPSLFG